MDEQSKLQGAMDLAVPGVIHGVTRMRMDRESELSGAKDLEREYLKAHKARR